MTFKKPFVHFFPLLLLIFLIGCVTPRLPESFTAQDLEGQGVLIGSASRGFGPQQYDSYLFKFRGVNNDVQKRIVMGKSTPFGPFNDDFEQGMLFAMPLPPGQYEFYDFNTMHTHDLTMIQWAPREDFSAPFSIEAGRVTYIGEISIAAKEIRVLPGGGYIESSFGSKTAGEPTLVFVDQRNRDIKLLKEKYPDLNWQDVKYPRMKITW